MPHIQQHGISAHLCRELRHTRVAYGMAKHHLLPKPRADNENDTQIYGQVKRRLIPEYCADRYGAAPGRE